MLRCRGARRVAARPDAYPSINASTRSGLPLPLTIFSGAAMSTAPVAFRPSGGAPGQAQVEPATAYRRYSRREPGRDPDNRRCKPSCGCSTSNAARPGRIGRSSRSPCSPEPG